MISAGVKGWYKTIRNKQSGSYILLHFLRSTFKTWNAM